MNSSLLLVVADSLHCIADGCADERSGNRMVVIDDCTGNRADDRAARV